MTLDLIKVDNKIRFDIKKISEDFSKLEAEFEIPYYASKFAFLMNDKRNPRVQLVRKKFEYELVEKNKEYYEALVEQYMEKTYGMVVEAKSIKYDVVILPSKFVVKMDFRLKEYTKKQKTSEDIVL